MQRASDGAADAARGTRYERGLVGQLEHDVPYCVSEGSTASMSCGDPTEVAFKDGTMRLAKPASTLPEPIS